MKIKDLITELLRQQEEGIIEVFLADFSGDIVVDFEVIRSSEYYEDTIPDKGSEYLLFEKTEKVDEEFHPEDEMSRIAGSILARSSSG